MNTVIIFLTLAASMSAYAFLMSILNKNHNLAWLKWESRLCTTLVLLVLVLSFQSLMMTNSGLYQLFGGLMLLSALNSIILSVVHYRNLSGVSEYPTTIVNTTMWLGIITFALLTLALLAFVASFPH